MYVGRIVALGKTAQNRNSALYRVSSRSFPNREVQHFDNSAFIVPREGHGDDVKINPYISYCCLRTTDSHIIVSNGTHTDVIVTKLESNYSMRDALTIVLQTFDYEKDQLNTPRIAAILDRNSDVGYLGIVTKDSLHVQGFTLKKSQIYYVATYERTTPSMAPAGHGFEANTAGEACDYILRKGVFADFEHPISSVCVIEDSPRGNFQIDVKNLMNS